MQTKLNIQFDFREMSDALAKAYTSLVNSNQIEDPIFTTIFGLSLAISGFVPFGFTKKTKNGRTNFRIIQTLFWSFEKSEKRGEKTTKVNFRLWKVLTAFKRAFAEIADEEVDDKKKE